MAGQNEAADRLVRGLFDALWRRIAIGPEGDPP
jgi:hypothetical protein